MSFKRLFIPVVSVSKARMPWVLTARDKGRNRVLTDAEGGPDLRGARSINQPQVRRVGSAGGGIDGVPDVGQCSVEEDLATVFVTDQANGFPDAGCVRNGVKVKK